MVEKIRKQKKADVAKQPVRTTRRAASHRAVKAPSPATAAPVAVSVASAAAPLDFLHGVGRRKEAVAMVRLYKNGEGIVVVNERPLEKFFPNFELQQRVRAPLLTAGQEDKVNVSARVAGGGSRGQADAVSLGIARALLGLNQTFRRSLRKVGLLTRDARIKERKKPGLKRARKAPQWQKR